MKKNRKGSNSSRVVFSPTTDGTETREDQFLSGRGCAIDNLARAERTRTTNSGETNEEIGISSSWEYNGGSTILIDHLKEFSYIFVYIEKFSLVSLNNNNNNNCR